MTSHANVWGAFTALAAFFVVIASFAVSAGPFSIDEVIYLQGVEALSERHSLVVLNGYEFFRSEPLKLWLLVEGPAGLVPQYPVATAIIGSLLFPLLGERALIFLNALASAATLILTRRVALEFGLGGRASLSASLILVFCTFFVEYAFGIWPHGISAFWVTLALALFKRALDDRSGTSAAVLSGCSIGVGCLFRTDVVLIAPALIALSFCLGDRPLRLIAALGFGMLPGIGVSSAANWIKFGAAIPLTYGANSGNVDPTAHLAAGLLLLLLLGLLGAGRYFDRLSSHTMPIWIAVGIGAVIMSPPASTMMTKYLSGAYALLFDLSSISDPRDGIVRGADGGLSFWGLPKKALGQSLPWLGLTLLALALPQAKERHQLNCVCVVVVAIWTLPYFLLAWHGGLASNMRYFVPLLPLLSIMAAACGRDLLKLGKVSFSPATGAWLATITATALTIANLAGPTILHQRLPTFLFAITIIFCAVAGWSRRVGQIIARAALAVTGIAFAMSAILSWQDLLASQQRREKMASAARFFLQVPPPSLVVGPPEAFYSHIGRPQRLLGVPDRISNKIDTGLLEAAIRSGYRAFVPTQQLDTIEALSDRLRRTGSTYSFEELTFSEVAASQRPIAPNGQ